MPFFDQISRLQELGYTGQGARIGHLDTGMAPNSMFPPSSIAAFCRVDGTGLIHTDEKPTDRKGHGTHTAGIICGNYSSDRGLGIAPAAKLYSGAVLGKSNSIIRLLKGLAWLYEQPIQIACLPFGIPEFNPILHPILNALVEKGVLCFASIGNEGPGKASSPANYHAILAVGAVGKRNHPCSFSGSVLDRNGHCIKPQIMAPGKRVAAPHLYGKLKKLSGTSQAAACAAGLAALLLQANPNLSAAQLHAVLLQSASHAQATDQQFSLYGALNPLKALQLAQQKHPPTTSRYSPSTLSGKFIDPNLKRELQKADKSNVRCAFIARKPKSLLKTLSAQLNESLLHHEFIQPGNVGIVEASPRLIAELTRQDAVLVASSCRIPLEQDFEGSFG